jgi:hypothetical protein
MQHIISNNDINNVEEGLPPPVLDDITRRFLWTAFKVLRSKDAIAITGSCVVALTLQNHGLPTFLPGDIDVFVKQNLELENQIFDRFFLHLHILTPLLAEGIDWQPKEIPIKKGLPANLKKYSNCNIDILHIIEINLFQVGEDVAVNRPKIQIIIVEDDRPSTPSDLSLFYLSPFERKVVTSFDFDIVQGAYNPNIGSITFAYTDTKQNILGMKFWYICNPGRPFRLPSAIERIKKYTDRGFVFMGFRDIDHPDIAISISKFTMCNPQAFLFGSDPYQAF